MATPRRSEPAAGDDPLSYLDQEERRIVAGHRDAHARLERALAELPGRDVGRALQRLAARIPVALSVETVGIRIRDTDDGLLHLVAHEGAPTREARRLALDALTVARAKSILALGAHHSFARDQGLRWLDGAWIMLAREPAGTIMTGCRSERRPGEDERALLRRIAARVGARLEGVDRHEETLRELSRRLAREATLLEPPAEGGGALASLRPRERAVLDLYTEGMSASEIAGLLVISPHTVRTHVKHAFRRLGVHSREEAADLVHREKVVQLI